MLDPASTWFDESIDPSRFGEGTVIHPGCRFSGKTLSVGPGCILGEEGPLTLRDCQLGAKVRLRGGSFDHATLLDGVDGGVGAHVRPGTLLEEEVAFGHCVGLKQTLLLPFVTMGSLANFCDCLMAGGTSRKDHSEVGSSYIHFNFTPHGDKATPSLLGDVPRGVMLDRPPIFLGGQGGLVGPSRLEFGTVLPAGQICRQDVLEPDLMVVPRPVAECARPYDMRVYGKVDRLAANNFAYIGNLLALDAWYRLARAPRLRATPHGAACLEGALARLGECLEERARWIGRLREKVALSADVLATQAPGSDALASQRNFLEEAPAFADRLAERLERRSEVAVSDAAAAALERLLAIEGTHVDAVRALSPADRETLATWLRAIVEIGSACPGPGKFSSRRNACD